MSNNNLMFIEDQARELIAHVRNSDQLGIPEDIRRLSECLLLSVILERINEHSSMPRTRRV